MLGVYRLPARAGLSMSELNPLPFRTQIWGGQLAVIRQIRRLIGSMDSPCISPGTSPYQREAHFELGRSSNVMFRPTPFVEISGSMSMISFSPRFFGECFSHRLRTIGSWAPCPSSSPRASTPWAPRRADCCFGSARSPASAS